MNENKAMHKKIPLKPKNRKQICQRMLVVNSIFLFPYVLITILDNNNNGVGLWFLLLFPMFLLFFFVSAFAILTIDDSGNRAFFISGKIDYLSKPVFYCLFFALQDNQVLGNHHTWRAIAIIIVSSSILAFNILLSQKQDSQTYFIDWTKAYYNGNSKAISQILNTKCNQKYLISILIIYWLYIISSINFEQIFHDNFNLSTNATLQFGYWQIGLWSTLASAIVAIIQILLCQKILYKTNIENKKHYLITIIMGTILALLSKNFIHNLTFWIILCITYTLITSKYYELIWMSNQQLNQNKKINNAIDHSLAP